MIFSDVRVAIACIVSVGFMPPTEFEGAEDSYGDISNEL